ncbi:MAG TPA: hypothetical protein VGQ23_06025 [Burkholderiaceae bacterium]|jgi:hypothetical protein|nr:hypothetical protein [Burkholderiaceae bacterium]
MNLLSFPLAVSLLACACAAAASPGAHGPNGEHLDAPTAAAAATGGGDPRLETFSEQFELVARLQRDALVIDLGRYATNEPVANAKIEIESGASKAQAMFDAASGSFRVTDRALLQSLSSPGTHTLMFTISAGKEADLLEATLRVPAPPAAQGGLPLSAWPMAASAVFVAGVALFGWRRRGARA